MDEIKIQLKSYQNLFKDDNENDMKLHLQN